MTIIEKIVILLSLNVILQCHSTYYHSEEHHSDQCHFNECYNTISCIILMRASLLIVIWFSVIFPIITPKIVPLLKTLL
jgi:hypothetical protein